MQDTKPKFELAFTNMPYVNVRQEFLVTRSYIYDDPTLSHRLRKGTTLTALLQNALLGLESSVHFSARLSLQMRGRTDEAEEIERRPMMNQRSLVRALYVSIPETVDRRFGLNGYSEKLLADTRQLYRDVRNPIFHGRVLTRGTEKAMLVPVFQHISELYRWLDSWFDIAVIMESNKGSRLRIQIPDLST